MVGPFYSVVMEVYSVRLTRDQISKLEDGEKTPSELIRQAIDLHV